MSDSFVDFQVITSVAILLPAVILITQGYYLDGFIIMLAAITSVIFHVSRDPVSHTVDRITAVLTAVVTIGAATLMFLHVERPGPRTLVILIALALAAYAFLFETAYPCATEGVREAWHGSWHVFAALALFAIFSEMRGCLQSTSVTVFVDIGRKLRSLYLAGRR